MSCATKGGIMSNDSEGVRLLQSVMLGLSLSRLPMRAALAELGDALAQPEALADLPGVLASWRRCVVGTVTPDTRAGVPTAEAGRLGIGGPLHRFGDEPAQRREAGALRLAREAGRVTSAELAALCGCSGETARQTLAKLCQDGHLAAYGERRGRWYGVLV